jgi:predicted PurR-regulated permease PerM
MNNTFKIPFYAKAALIFISCFAFIFTMHVGRSIIVPIVFALILAILINPMVNYFHRKGINRLISISTAVTITVFAVLGTLFLISTRIDSFTETYPQLKTKIEATNLEGVRWISKTFNVRQWQIKAWAKEKKSDAIDDFEFKENITEIGRVMVTILLLPVYLFMILYYKPLLLEFVHRTFRVAHHKTVTEVLHNTKAIIQGYIVGLFFEMLIMAVLNSVGLLLLGIQYAVILGIIGAILNIIPYIGGIIATLLAMTIAFVTKDSLTYPIFVLLIYIIIQLIDNNYIVPKIVASRVRLNALVSIIVVLIGGAIWGIAGMFLSIPLTAILKVVFDHVDPLKPWGYLLGNTVPTSSGLSQHKPNE